MTMSNRGRASSRLPVRCLQAAGLLGCCLMSFHAHAHGVAGDRVFPATLATDDPAASSEISLPTVDWFHQSRNDDGTIPTETDIGGELDVLVAPNLALGIAPTWSSVTAKRNPGAYGFQNLEVNGKYQLYTGSESETIVSVGLTAEIGGSGSRRLGSDQDSTLTPTVYFGQGMGFLPDSMALLRPFAVTGTLGYSLEQGSGGETQFQPGIAIEYSMPYLKSAVKDYGLPEFVNHLVPVVELPLTLGLNGSSDDRTLNGSVNPGLIYQGQSWQFGVEAIMPIRSGDQHNVGVIGQFHVYLDDLMPDVFGQPLIGGHSL